MDKKARGIDQIIQSAMQEGAFDNLPGKGKPLKLDENPHLDPEWQLAYHLLKQNGFAPNFVEKRQAIEMELADARQTLARTWAWRVTSLSEGGSAEFVEAEWARAKNAFRETIEKVNKKIRDYNLGIPVQTLYRPLVVLEKEISIITGSEA